MTSEKTVSERDLTKTMTPTEFARKHHVNRYNVYYWMKTYGYGFKDGRFWYLTEQEQKEMLRLQESQPDGKKFAKNVSSKSSRQHSAESVESLIANLGVDEGKAKTIRYLMQPEVTSMFIDLFQAIGDFKEGYENLYDHEKALLMMGYVVGLKEIGQLSIRDGYPQYKFLIPKDMDGYTIVYSVRNQVYYLDIISKMRKTFVDLEYSKTDISL